MTTGTVTKVPLMSLANQMPLDFIMELLWSSDQHGAQCFLITVANQCESNSNGMNRFISFVSVVYHW
jgi:hypothetical protein